MIGHRRILVTVLCGLIVGVTGGMASAQEDPPEAQQAAPKTFLSASKVLLEGKAQADGVLAFIFEPEGGEAKQVRVNVLKKTVSKKIAEDLAKELTFTAGKGYKVTHSAGKVVIKAKSKSPAFSLSVDQQSVNGVSVRIKKK